MQGLFEQGIGKIAPVSGHRRAMPAGIPLLGPMAVSARLAWARWSAEVEELGGLLADPPEPLGDSAVVGVAHHLGNLREVGDTAVEQHDDLAVAFV